MATTTQTAPRAPLVRNACPAEPRERLPEATIPARCAAEQIQRDILEMLNAMYEMAQLLDERQQTQQRQLARQQQRIFALQAGRESEVAQ